MTKIKKRSNLILIYSVSFAVVAVGVYLGVLVYLSNKAEEAPIVTDNGSDILTPEEQQKWLDRFKGPTTPLPPPPPANDSSPPPPQDSEYAGGTVLTPEEYDMLINTGSIKK